VVVGPVGQ